MPDNDNIMDAETKNVLEGLDTLLSALFGVPSIEDIIAPVKEDIDGQDDGDEEHSFTAEDIDTIYNALADTQIAYLLEQSKNPTDAMRARIKALNVVGPKVTHLREDLRLTREQTGHDHGLLVLEPEAVELAIQTGLSFS